MSVHELRPEPGDYDYVFGRREPRLSIRSGDIVEFSTEDCFNGRVTSPDQKPSEVCDFSELNPVTGPLYVEDAEPGDLLAVHFIDIRPSRGHAVSAAFPLFGALTSTHETATLQDPLQERVWFYDIDLERWTATYRARNSDFVLDLPLDPMHGVVGVAPAGGEVRLVVTPSNHGGNMDTPEARAGTTVYLPINVPGALLAIGDGHARQGEGEVIGTGLECAMESVIAVEVVKGAAPAWPRLEDDEHLMTTGSVRPLEDAFRISQKELVEWTSSLTGLDALDALQLVSQLGLAPAANVCDPNYTMVAKLPKWAIANAQAYGGAHRRLRAAAAEYRLR